MLTLSWLKPCHILKKLNFDPQGVNWTFPHHGGGGGGGGGGGAQIVWPTPLFTSLWTPRFACMVKHRHSNSKISTIYDPLPYCSKWSESGCKPHLSPTRYPAPGEGWGLSLIGAGQDSLGEKILNLRASASGYKGVKRRITAIKVTGMGCMHGALHATETVTLFAGLYISLHLSFGLLSPPLIW